MNKTMKLKSKQLGVTISGMLFLAVIVGVLFIVGARVVPAVIEYQSILKAINTIGSSGDDSIVGIRSAFDRNKETGYFDAISGKDLVIEKINGKYAISFAYQKEIELVGPVYLLLKLDGKSKFNSYQ